MKKLRPSGSRVLVRRHESETTTSAGILLPGKGEKANRGEIIAVGEGTLLDNGEIRPLSFKAGDQVLFGGYHGESNTVKIDGIEHLIISASDILAVIEE